jgi:hypothetical protein
MYIADRNYRTFNTHIFIQLFSFIQLGRSVGCLLYCCLGVTVLSKECVTFSGKRKKGGNYNKK